MERSARRLSGAGRLGEVRFDRQVMRGDGRFGAKPMRGLRFQQSLAGLRVLWSELDVMVSRNTVHSIRGTVVPLRSRRLTGKKRVDTRRARQIARGAVSDPGIERPPELVAYAGQPAKPRPARRAYVVEVNDAQQDEHAETAWCIVVDAGTGRVLAKWRGFAARPPSTPDNTAPPRGQNASPTARAAATKKVLLQYVDAGYQNVTVTPNYRDIWTLGNPLWAFAVSVSTGWPTVAYLRDFDTFGSGLGSTAAASVRDTYGVARHICVVRAFCGRDGGSDRSYNRHFVTATGPAPTFRSGPAVRSAHGRRSARSLRSGRRRALRNQRVGHGAPRLRRGRGQGEQPTPNEVRNRQGVRSQAGRAP
jgi:hypothetical protein